MTEQWVNQRNSIWNQDPRADEVLKESYQAKLSFRDIAAKIWEWTGLRVTRNACIGRVNRLRKSGTEGLETRPEDLSRRRPPRPKQPRVWKPKPMGAATEPEIVQPSPPRFLGLSFAELDIGPIPRFCRYPKREADEGPTLYCGQPVKEGSSYCPYCHSICWYKGRAPIAKAVYGPAAREIR